MDTRRLCRYHSAQRFFGPTPEDREALILEPFFALNTYAGWDWVTFYNTPLYIRRWFIKRLNEEFDKAQEKNQPPPSKAPHHNTPDIRAMQGKVRPQVPPNLRGKPFI